MILYYFPYHEMDITRIIEIIEKKLNKQNSLKEKRLERGLSQSELSKISGVNLRTLKAYEQNKIALESVQAGTLYLLARTLNCTIEDLLK